MGPNQFTHNRSQPTNNDLRNHFEGHIKERNGPKVCSRFRNISFFRNEIHKGLKKRFWNEPISKSLVDHFRHNRRNLTPELRVEDRQDIIRSRATIFFHSKNHFSNIFQRCSMQQTISLNLWYLKSYRNRVKLITNHLLKPAKEGREEVSDMIGQRVKVARPGSLNFKEPNVILVPFN